MSKLEVKQKQTSEKTNVERSNTQDSCRVQGQEVQPGAWICDPEAAKSVLTL